MGNRLQQPQSLVKVDPFHEFGRCLDYVQLGSLPGVDLVAGKNTTPLTGYSKVVGLPGTALANTGGTGSLSTIKTINAFPFVLFAYGYVNSAADTWDLALLSNSGGGYLCNIRNLSSTAAGFQLRFNFGTTQTLSATLSTAVNTPLCAIVQVFSATDYRLYINGQQLNGTASPGTFGSFNQVGVPTHHLNGGIWIQGYGQGRTIPDSVALDLSRNPQKLWSIFKSDTNIQSLKAAAGGPAQYTLTAQGGSYTKSGASVTLLKSKLITAQGGSYSQTGASATLKYNRLLSAQGGSYSKSGADAILLRHKNLSAQGGSYAKTGASATITYTGLANSYTLTCQGGVYVKSGASATLLKSKNLTCQGGAYTFTGRSAVLTYSGAPPVTGGLQKYLEVRSGELLILKPLG